MGNKDVPQAEKCDENVRAAVEKVSGWVKQGVKRKAGAPSADAAQLLLWCCHTAILILFIFYLISLCVSREEGMLPREREPDHIKPQGCSFLSPSFPHSLLFDSGSQSHSVITSSPRYTSRFLILFDISLKMSFTGQLLSSCAFASLLTVGDEIIFRNSHSFFPFPSIIDIRGTNLYENLMADQKMHHFSAQSGVSLSREL